MKSQKGFTLIELLVVIAIIGVLSSVVLASVQGAKAKSRDAQVRLQVEQIINALSLARDPSTGAFPGVNGWQCLKSSGSCGSGSPVGNPALMATLSSYIPSVPVPPNPPFDSTTLLNGSYVYFANAAAPAFLGSPAGSYIMWAQSQPLAGCTVSAYPSNCSSCQGVYYGNTIGDANNYYCVQLIPGS